MLGKIPSSYHRMVKCKMRLNPKRESGKVAKSGQPNMESITGRTQEFRITLPNGFTTLNGEREGSVDMLNDNLTTAIHRASSRCGRGST